MKKEDIPQDELLFDGHRTACYALAEDGAYVMGQSLGWEPVNVANVQAWEFIHQQVLRVVDDILANKKSVLAFHMERCQMDVKLLAKYVDLPQWRVRRHLKPAVFNRLKPKLIERYATIFQISVDDFLKLPDPNSISIPVETNE